MNGLAWFGVSSADSTQRAYLGIRPKSLINTSKKSRFHIFNFRHIIEEIETNNRNQNFDLLIPKELNLPQVSKSTRSVDIIPNTSTTKKTTSLWIDKYSPSEFSDLLTEDVRIFLI